MELSVRVASAKSSLASAGFAAEPAIESRMFFQLAAMSSGPPTGLVSLLASIDSADALWRAADSAFGDEGAEDAAVVLLSGASALAPTGQGAGDSAPAAVPMA